LDPKRRAIFEMSAMGAFEVQFCDEENAATTLECCAPTDAVLVLFADLKAAEHSFAAGLRFDKLNVGHVPEAPGRAELHPSVFLGDGERAAIERLIERGVEVVVQPLPNDKARSMSPRAKPPAGPKKRSAQRREGRVRVVNEKGLHLRAAHVLVQLTSSIQSEVRIGAPGQMVNAKSLLGLTTLGATRGTELQLVVEGPDAEEAFERIVRLFESGFEEGSVGAGA
jgi:phosphocarrier protein